MNLQKIEDLLRKYERGETSLRDETMLRSFFQKEEVPSHWAGYRELFRFFQSAGREEIPNPDFDKKLLDALENAANNEHKKTRIKRLYPVFALAASLILFLGWSLFFQNRGSGPGTYDDPQMALAETKKVLLMVSDELNTGMDEMTSIQEFHTGMDNLSNVHTFQDGLNNLKKISVLDKSKDIIKQKTETP